ncbi:hypothetical protein Q9L58_005648 [Maublancomyces gigas]|uniref:C2H2-type domain-containing protein n=1 Tax=Discina gigas TaxID=1032678 RepID=A0ABR3GHZ9_9PEZI
MDSTPTRIISSPSLNYHCQPCGISMDKATIDSHLAGKKHRKRCADLGAMEADCALAPPPSVAVQHPVTANGGTDIPQALVDASGSEPDKGTTTDGVEKNMASGMHTQSAAPETVPTVTRSRRRPHNNQFGSIGEAYRSGAMFDKGPVGEGRKWVPPAPSEMWTALFKIPDRITSLITPEAIGPGESETSAGKRRGIFAKGTAVKGEEESRVLGAYTDSDEKRIGTGQAADSPEPESTLTLQPESSTPKFATEAAHPAEATIPSGRAIQDANPTRWYCWSCKTDFPTDQREEHRGSLLHALRRGEIPTFDVEQLTIGTPTAPSDEIQHSPALLQPAVAIDEFHCVLCGQTRKLAGYEGHMKSAKHRQSGFRVGPAEDSTMPSTIACHSRPWTWYCGTCMVDLHVDAKEAHLAQEHGSNL